ncbi:hypothetical protein StoSoilA2_43890 [Arthrobacter sp. StoSoilA2]|nr:hypothetical protein StoSoilA2_43890 [Arthrobacter sp. StoSoilA2]
MVVPPLPVPLQTRLKRPTAATNLPALPHYRWGSAFSQSGAAVVPCIFRGEEIYSPTAAFRARYAATCARLAQLPVSQ